MRIVLVSSLASVSTAAHFVNALRRAGHDLLVVSDVPAPGVDVLAPEAPDLAALCRAKGFTPDFAFFVEGGTMRLLPRGLEHLDGPTAWYAIDTHMDYAKHVRIGRCFDVTFVAQKEFVAPLRADGVTGALWLPLAFPADLLPAEPVARDLDLAFVGSVDPVMHPARARVLGELSALVGASACGAAPAVEMIRRYARARLVYNRSVRNDVNMRYFEAMGAGAVLLTDPAVANGAEDLFEEGRHYLAYRSEAELKALVTGLLAEPERIAAIGRAAQDLVLERHTYDHRAAEVVRVMNGRAKTARPEASDYFAALVALNLGAPAIAAAADAVAGMGAGTRLQVFNRGAAAVMRLASGGMRFGLGLARGLKRGAR